MRLGLCCTFVEEPIRFRQTTATAVAKLAPAERRDKLRALACQNLVALAAAIELCAARGIGCFRVLSQILPLRTHPELGYDADMLGGATVAGFRACKELAKAHGVRLTFHPDQFVVLSSPSEAVVESSLAEIEHQAEVAEWIGADVITIHGGGAYGDRGSALARLRGNLERLSPRARARIALENDDRVYAPSDLIPICVELGVPLVYDVHHHRCHPDGLSIAEATQGSISTWDREPVLHISSPREGWGGASPSHHADYVSLRDFPREWEALEVTVEVEAKAKELAVARLARGLEDRRRRRRRA